MTVVVPVRDNAMGIERLYQWWSDLDPTNRPCDMIVVDDGLQSPLPSCRGARVLRSAPRGPASARNLGWRTASTRWVAFLDSDCVPEASWPGSLAAEWDGEIGVQGRVRAIGRDILSRYYDAQGILRPMQWSEDGRPAYLITANALVHRAALAAVGGFRETFSLAAGEDVDLGLRLSRVGMLRWSAAATVAHDFEPSLIALVRRFARYGRGNRRLALEHGALASGFVPKPFQAVSGSLTDTCLSALAFTALVAGWAVEAAVDR